MLPSGTVAYLRRRFEEGDVVLFTGAGFSRDASSQAGGRVPSVDDLRRMLSELVYPGSAVDPADSLADLFGVARTRAYNRVREILERYFVVDRSNLPAMYADILGAAWHRVYTLNIVDLPEAVAASATLPRAIVSLTPSRLNVDNHSAALQVVHLNGRWDDGPERVTFSPFDFGNRFPGRDPLHAQCAVDILARPIVFIGTTLDEPPLWQHIQLRRSATGRDLRRRSFLVTPSLSRSRRDLLERELHVEHLPLRLDEFYEQVFKPASGGSAEYYRKREERSLWDSTLEKPPLVTELVAKATKLALPGEYLLGREPSWDDLVKGRAAVREYEQELAHLADSILAAGTGPRPPILLVGTAGSGKSTAIMRLALHLTARGARCGWTSTELNVSPADLRSLAALGELPDVVVIDDADRFGNDVSLLARDLSKAKSAPLVILAVRAGRVERISDRLTLNKVIHHEVVIPHLTDKDIVAILAVLKDENRLGVLRNVPQHRQIAVFRNREQANRDLLVAMLEATSGRRFAQKLEEELEQLDGEQRFIYAMVAIATAYRIGLSRNQVLLGLGDASNASLQAIDDLTRRLLIVPDHRGDLRVRHRVVGERVVRYLTRSGTLRDPLQSLTIALATELGPLRQRNSSSYRTVKVLMNHDWLRKALRPDPARGFLAELEPYMAWDHHYWLQRGSLELEFGDRSLAENFLNQAAGIEPDDHLVQTEVGYLRLMIALEEKDSAVAREMFDAGLATLHGVIQSRNHFDPHQYDIYGRMALKWIDRPDISDSERESTLRDALGVVEQGRTKHPSDSRLRELYVKIANRRLGHKDPT